MWEVHGAIVLSQSHCPPEERLSSKEVGGKLWFINCSKYSARRGGGRGGGGGGSGSIFSQTPATFEWSPGNREEKRGRWATWPTARKERGDPTARVSNETSPKLKGSACGGVCVCVWKWKYQIGILLLDLKVYSNKSVAKFKKKKRKKKKSRYWSIDNMCENKDFYCQQNFS